MKLVHGGDWAGFEARYGQTPLDFSVNISPLGMPESVRQAIVGAVTDADRYPDPLCRKLRAKLAEKEDVPMGWVLCGSGAADLIFRVVLACRPRRALLPAPTFAEYEAALQTAGCQITYYGLREESDFAFDGGILQAIQPGMDIVFLCQPNNPTGRTIPRPLLLEILTRCRGIGALLVTDECFLDFLDDPAAFTLVGALEEYPNLLILRSFTKLYAMAGVRLGYCLSSDPLLLNAMVSAGPPWAVSSLAQAAGLAALEEAEYVQRTRTLIQTERPWLAAQLAGLGLRVIPGEASFLLFRCGAPLSAPLGQKGILLRECGNYRGLDAAWYRAAVRNHEDNILLIQAIKEVLAGGEMYHGPGNYVRRGQEPALRGAVPYF